MATFTSNTYDGRYLQLYISESVNPTSNSSTLTWTLTSAGGNSTYYTVDTTTITINGTQVYYKARTSWEDRVFPAAKGFVSGTLEVPHNSDGTKTVWVEFTTRVYVFGPLDYGGTMTLTSIDRTAPTVSCAIGNLSAGGFSITATSSATANLWQYSINGGSTYTTFSSSSGTTSSVTLSSLAPNTTYSVRVRARKKSNYVYGYSGTVSVKTLGGAFINSCDIITVDDATVSFNINATVYSSDYLYYLYIQNGDTPYISFSPRSWSVGTTNHTFTLTAEERMSLLEAMSGMKSFSATMKLVTMNGAVQVGSASTVATIVQTTAANSAPTMADFTYEDSRSTTAAVTGNNQLFIQGYSYLYVTPGTATAKNGASIVQYAATCNGVTRSNTTGAALNLYGIAKYGTLDVVVTATDSRGYTVSKTQQITVIPYDRPRISSISLRRTNDIEAEMQLVFNGSISPISVSGTQKNNLMLVQYQYKLTSAASYGAYTSITDAVTKNGTLFSFSNLELCNLDANSSYDFHIRICDSLSSLSVVDLFFVVPQGTPLVALRKRKVGINTPNPETALHVAGGGRFEGNVNFDGNVQIQGTLTPSVIDYPFEKPYFGICESAADADTKVVTADEFTLKKGCLIAVQFANTNTSSTPAMNVNGTGNIAICGLNGYYVAKEMWVARQVVHFVFNGTWWIALNSIPASTTQYGTTKLSNSVSSSDTTLAATAYAVKLAYDRSSWNSISLTNALAIAYGGTGATTAAAARSNLGIYCSHLYSGSLSSGSITFHYGSYKAYIIDGQPSSGASKMSLVVPSGAITTSDISWQIADEVNYRAFKLRYSGSTATLTMGGGTGYVNNVYGVN